MTILTWSSVHCSAQVIKKHITLPTLSMNLRLCSDIEVLMILHHSFFINSLGTYIILMHACFVVPLLFPFPPLYGLIMRIMLRSSATYKRNKNSWFVWNISTFGMYTFLAETGGNNNCIIENIFLDKITMCPLGRWKLIPGIVEM